VNRSNCPPCLLPAVISTEHLVTDFFGVALAIADKLDDQFGATAPTYLVRDNDGAYGRAFTNRVWTMGIRDRPISPRSPWQNPYVERLIGTLRRECLDHVLIYGERHLRRILTLYSLYYNEKRTHLGLAKDAPLRRPVQRSGTIMVTPILSGLHHRYARI
jgi:transposase InsO family protein